MLKNIFSRLLEDEIQYEQHDFNKIGYEAKVKCIQIDDQCQLLVLSQNHDVFTVY